MKTNWKEENDWLFIDERPCGGVTILYMEDSSNTIIVDGENCLMKCFSEKRRLSFLDYEVGGCNC